MRSSPITPQSEEDLRGRCRFEAGCVVAFIVAWLCCGVSMLFVVGVLRLWLSMRCWVLGVVVVVVVIAVEVVACS